MKRFDIDGYESSMIYLDNGEPVLYIELSENVILKNQVEAYSRDADRLMSQNAELKEKCITHAQIENDLMDEIKWLKQRLGE